MKIQIILTIIVSAILSMPAYAQHAGAAATSSQGSANAVGGGSLSVQTGIQEHPSFPAAQYTYAYAKGTELVPSSFMVYADAVRLGQAMLAIQPKTLGEVAAEYRAAKGKKQ